MKNIPLILALALAAVLSGPAAMAYELSGSADHMPWSGYWWPTQKGELVNGYHLESPSPSPVEKYDLYTAGKYPDKATQWADNPANPVYNSSAPNWWGFCHAWANAALLEDVDFVPSTARNIFFGVGDKKGLLTMVHHDDPQIYRVVDADPLIFHQLLLEYIGQNRIGLVSDLDCTEEVWSHPVYAYAMEVAPGADKDAVSCTISYASDFVRPDYQGTLSMTATYTYDLNKDSEGAYTFGQWTGTSVTEHPHSMWVPLEQAFDCPVMDYQTVKTIVAGTDDGLDTTSPLMPGHFLGVLEQGLDKTLELYNPGDVKSLTLWAGLDPQSPGRNVTLTVSRDGAVVAQKTLGETLSRVDLDAPGDAKCRVTLGLGDDFYDLAQVHLYLDVSFDETAYLVGLPGSIDWYGLALANKDVDKDNKVLAVVLDDTGLPVNSAQGLTGVDKAAGWSGVIDYHVTQDTYRGATPRVLAVTSQRDMEPLELKAATRSLYGMPDIRPWNGNTADQYVLPEMTDSFNLNKTGYLYLFNPSQVNGTATLDYYSASGSLLKSAGLSLEARQSQGYAPGAYPGSASFNGYALATIQAGELTGSNVVTLDRTYTFEMPPLPGGTTWYAPHVAEAGGWNTDVVLYNLTDSGVTATITITSGDISQSASVSLAARQRVSSVVQDLFPSLDEEQMDQCWLKVESSGEVAGYFKFEHQGGMLTALPLFAPDELSTVLRLPHVDSSQYWWTGIAFFNSSSSKTSVTMKAMDKQGQELASATVEVRGKTKYVAPVESIFPQERSDISNIVITSGRAISGLVLYGDREDDGYLSGLTLH